MKRSLQYSLIIMPLFIYGCANPPPEVNASRSLIEKVTPTASQKTVPEELWQKLNHQIEGTSFTYNQVTVFLEDSYYSALGNVCRNIQLIKNETQPSQKRVVCQQVSKLKQTDSAEQTEETQQIWVLVPKVVKNKHQTINFDEGSM